MTTTKKPADPLFRLILGIVIGLIVVNAGLVLYRDSLPAMTETPLYVPMIHIFAVLECATIAFLALGRSRALKDPLSYWMGIAFAVFAISNVVYILTWPGLLADGGSLIGDSPNTAAWVIALGQTIFCILLITAVRARWPGEGALKENRWAWSIVAWLMSIILFNGLLIVFEANLPVIIGSTEAFTSLQIIVDGVNIFVFVAGAALATWHYRQTHELLLGYLALDLWLSFFGSTEVILGGRHYALLWYTGRLVVIAGSLIVLFGLLWEYVRLYRREQEKTHELEASIAERHHVEESLRENEAILRGILDAVQDSIWLFSADGVIITANEIALSRMQKPVKEVIGAHFGQLMPDELVRSRQACLDEVIETGRPVELEDERAGIIFHHNFYPIKDADGRVTQIAAFSRDITERKRAEEALQQSEARFKAVAETTPVAIGVVSLPDAKFLYVNDAYAKAFGYAPDELLNRAAPDIYCELADREKILQLLRENGNVADYEVRLKRKDGSMFWGMSATRPITFAGQTALLGAFIDVTERKQVEEALRQSEERLRFHTENSPMAVIEWDMNFIVTRWSGESEKMFGWSAAETIGRPIMDLNMIFEEDVPIVQKTMERLSDGVSKQVVSGNRNYTKDRRIIYCEWYNSILADQQGNMLSVMSQVLDVTGRKQAEEALRASEERFKAIASSTPDHILVQDCDLRYTFVVNPQMGLSEQDMLGRTDQDFLAKDDAENLTLIKRQVLDTGKAVHVEAPLISPGGETQFFDGSYVPKYDPAGQVDGLIGYFKNVTELKRIEMALRESEERYHNLFDTIDQGFCVIEMIFDAQGKPVDYRFLEVNGAFEKQTGLHEAQGKLMRKLAPAHEERWFEIYGKVALTGTPARFMDEARALDRWYDVYAYRVGNPEERQVAILFNDISDYKRAEEALRFQANVLANIHDAVFTMTTDMKITSWNKAAEELYGWTVEEVIGRNGADVVQTETSPDTRAEWVADVDAGGHRAGVLLHHRKNGTPVWVEASVIPLRDGAGRITGLAAANRDITERKQAEEQLERSNQKLNEILVSIQDDFYVLDRDWKFVYASKLFTSKIGKEPEDFAGQNIWEMFPKHVGTAFEENFRAAMEKREVRRFEVGGQYTAAWYRMTAFPSADGITVLGTDITERKKAELQLAKVASFPERNPNPIIELEHSGKVGYLNPKARELFPDIAGAGFEHPMLAGLEQVIEKFEEEKLETSLAREVKAGDAYYLQTIANVPESRAIRLYNVEITARKRAENSVQTRMHLTEFAATHSLDEILQETLDEVGKITDSPIGFYHFVEADQETLALQTWSTRTLREFCTAEGKGLHYNVSDAGVWVDCIHQRRPVIHNDYASLPNRKGLPEGHAQVIRELVVPILRGDRVVSILGVGNKPSDYTEKDVEMVSYLADVAWEIAERKRTEELLREATLQKQASQYARTLLEVSIDPLVTISPEGKITDVNEATIQATGAPRQELVGANFSSYFTEPEKAEQGYKQVFADGFVTNYPLTVRHRNGHLMDVLYNASLYKDANGNVQGVFAAARDVTAQKQVEAELKRHQENLAMLVKERTSKLEESNRELARSNENLEQFAYVASHDLQEPLRIMSSYSQLLEKRYKGQLDQDANEFIDFIVDAASRMQKLITDLLAYSRAGREATDLVEVDCNKVVRRLVTNMAATIESADGNVTFDRLPTILAHESSVIQLFQNLIGNALKFRGEQPPGIHISARQDGGEWVFSVRDNGIGIESQYSQRIFMIFQRLHSREKYPGTGIGLSICKKIVDNLGGRIWVESEPGQGSTFTFTVPVRKTEAANARAE
jgi:PAS domain S-box-containing protein